MHAMKKASSWAGRLFLILFALPFAGVGAGAMFYIGWCVWDWQRMQSWVEVPCQILSVNLETHHGDDSNTYKAVAKYQYTHQGQPYTSETVGIHNSSDNIGSYHQRVADELKAAQRRGGTFRCFVNPDHPDEAVLYRKIRIEIIGFATIFALVFGGVGFGLMFWSIYSVKHERRETQLQHAHPGQPWTWNPQWVAGEIKSSNKAAMIGMFVFAALWNLISAPAIFFVPGAVMDGNYLALVALLFPLIGLGLLLGAVYMFLRWTKYGNSVFQMAAVPGVVGGQIAGVVYTNTKVKAKDGFRVKLSCVETVTSGSGKNRSTSEKIRWQDEKVLHRELAEYDLSRSAIPVQFGIPFDAMESSTANDSRRVHWKLEVTAATPGIDYSAEFRVPVFRTPDSSPNFKPDESALAAYQDSLSPEDAIRATGIRVQPIPGGMQLDFPPAQRPGAALGLTLFLTIWLGAIWLMIALGAPIFFPIVFGLFALLMVWGALDLWFWKSTISAESGAITFKTGIFGIGAAKTYTIDEIESLKPKSGMQAGNTLYYMLQLTTADGKKHVIGKRLPSQSEAQRVADFIIDTLTQV